MLPPNGTGILLEVGEILGASGSTSAVLQNQLPPPQVKPASRIRGSQPPQAEGTVTGEQRRKKRRTQKSTDVLGEQTDSLGSGVPWWEKCREKDETLKDQMKHWKKEHGAVTINGGSSYKLPTVVGRTRGVPAMGN